MNLTEEQKNWFKGLQDIRIFLSKALDLSAADGVKKESGDDMYSDQAHFIYELIQNASDVKATIITFKLFKHGLYFIHDGTIHFTISQPDTQEDRKIEKRDSKIGKLGHVNAICSIGNSNKKNEPNNIGKFGVGFKSVFQYTKTPHIYDKNFQFKITDYIVPILLSEDLKDRNEHETIFYFPFDNEEMPSEKAFLEISNKLKDLKYPLLFVNNLKEINWEIDCQDLKENGLYLKEEKFIQNYGTIYCYQISLCQQIGSKFSNEELIVFNRKQNENGLYYTIAFLINEQKQLEPKVESAFCYFQTKEFTNLNFMIHAPFLLNNSRESIIRKNEHNENLILNLAELSAESLHILKGMNLLNDNIFDIIPYKKPTEDDLFKSFYFTIRKKLLNDELLPSFNGEFTRPENAYWAYSPDLAKLFSNSQLADLVKNPKAKWVFTTIGTNLKDNGVLKEYIYSLTDTQNKLPNLVKDILDLENKIARLITADFIEKQEMEWLHSFYKFLSERKSYQEKFETVPIFLDQNGKACAAFEKKGNKTYPILFLPNSLNDSDYKKINNDLLENDITKEFIISFGIKDVNKKDELYRLVSKIKEGSISEPSKYFNFFFDYFKMCTTEDINDSIDLIKDVKFIRYNNQSNEVNFTNAEELYFKDNILVDYFKYKPDAKFVDLDYYNSSIKTSDTVILKSFFIKLGVSELPKININKINLKSYNNFEPKFASKQIKIVLTQYNLKPQKGIKPLEIVIKKIDGYLEFLKNINFESSVQFYALFTKILDNSKHNYNIYYEYKYLERGNEQSEKLDFSILKDLNDDKWLYNKSKNLVSPSEITIEELHDAYNRNQQLEKLITFKTTETREQGIVKFKDKEEADLAQKLLDAYYNNIEKSKNDINYNNQLENESDSDLKLIDAKNVEIISIDFKDIKRKEKYEGNTYSEKEKNIINNESEKKINVLNKNITKNKLSQKSLEKIGKWGQDISLIDIENEFQKDIESDNIEIINLNENGKVGEGADIIVKRNGEEIRIIEVKTTLGDIDSPHSISGYQWETIKKYYNDNDGEKYWLYCVFNAGKGNCQLIKIQNPIKEWKEGRLFAHAINFILTK